MSIKERLENEDVILAVIVSQDHLVPENPGSTCGPGRLLKRPTSVHTERVYDSGDFSQLGIGN